MSRDLTVDMAAAVSAATVRPLIIIKIGYAGGEVRLHSGKGNLTFNAQTYTGIGTVGTVADIEESLDESPGRATISFPANSAIVTLALAEFARGRPVYIWLGARNLSTLALIADPSLEFEGTISHHTGSDPLGGAGEIILHCVDESADQERPLEQRYTDEEQQRLYPGDLGLEYVTDLPNKKFTWGNANVRVAMPVGPNPGTDDSTIGIG